MRHIPRFLILADDLTGALDTGIYFAASGVAVQVAPLAEHALNALLSDAQVLVINTNSRHLPPPSAYNIVFRTARLARQAGFEWVYKKTDSALRGNLGSELSAVLDAYGESSLAFAPALPKMQRITQGGVHFIEGIPVAHSPLGDDPFSPVRHSHIDKLLATQTGKPVVLHPPGESAPALSTPGIHVYDAATDADLAQIAHHLAHTPQRLFSGCSGFAAALAEQFFPKSSPAAMPALSAPLFVVCGSINPVTRRQIAAARLAGAAYTALQPPQKLESSWLHSAECCTLCTQLLQSTQTHPLCILDTGDSGSSNDTTAYAKAHSIHVEELRLRIATQLGQLTKQLLQQGLEATLLCTGGDTLLALIQALGLPPLTPLCEIMPGIVLSRLIYRQTTYHLLSKSGGFGSPNLFCTLVETIEKGALQ